jgi:protocatechuate 3,4-dioxygenase alpha subunit
MTLPVTQLATTPLPTAPSQTTPLAVTPSQTVGPFFGIGLPYADGTRLVPEWRPDAITLHGWVTDGAGAPLPDALVEVWQPDATGHISRAVGAIVRTERFSGFGRCGTDADGHYRFTTLKPGVARLAAAGSAAGSDPEGHVAPHVAAPHAAAGDLVPGTAAPNDAGPDRAVPHAVPHAAPSGGPTAGSAAPHIAVLVFARGLLKPVATRVYFPGEPANAADPLLVSLAPDRRATLVAIADGDGSYRFDVRLQGEKETVFLAL